MRGAIIHGALLVVMLVFGYRTWTRDKTVAPDLGSVVLWDKSESDLVSIEYKTDKKIVRLEQRGTGKDAYWWGSDTAIDKDAKKTKEFPLGEGGDKIVKGYTAARAVREIGKPDDKQKKDYKLDDTKGTITVSFKGGTSRVFKVGGTVYGNSERYVIDAASGEAYVLSKDIVAGLETGETSLHLLDPRGFDAVKLEALTIEGGGKTKNVARITTGVEGQQVKTWGDPATQKANQAIANFIDNTNNLKPTDYAPDMKVADLTPVMKLTYKDATGATLGTLQLYKHEKAGVLPAGAELDPANPPKGETEWLIVTEKTRVPAVVRKDVAERAEGDLSNVMSDQPVEPVKSADPHGNPFGKTPLPPRPPTPPPGAGSGSGSAAISPHGMPPMPPAPPTGAPPPTPPAPPPAHAGSAAPAPAAGSGSAAH